MSLEDIWNKSLLFIEKKIGAGAFELWFKPMRLSYLRDNSAVVEIPNRFFREWIEDYHPNIISEALESASGHPVTVKFKIAEKENSSVKRMDARLEDRRQRLASKGIYLNPKYTFENFVSGPSNQFAYAAAKAIADSPGTTYNPLFIYGGVGLGKTHLITAIGNALADKRRDFNILYVSSEQFTNEAVSSMRHNKMEEFKVKYRTLDLLLVDDVQFLEKKTSTQEELFNTINTLYERQKQIVLSSDRPPKEIKDVTDRLRSRFGMGLIADIQPPEIELRMAIIQKKAEIDRIKLEPDVTNFLASRIRSNIRELEGCLIRLAAHSSLTGQPINVTMAKSILKDRLTDDNKAVTVEQVLKAVSEYFGIKHIDMKSRKRTKEIAFPRQVAMYISKQLTNCSLSDIGKNFGGKDHATVIYACRQIEGKRGQDEDMDRTIEALINRIRG